MSNIYPQKPTKTPYLYASVNKTIKADYLIKKPSSDPDERKLSSLPARKNEARNTNEEPSRNAALYDPMTNLAQYNETKKKMKSKTNISEEEIAEEESDDNTKKKKMKAMQGEKFYQDARSSTSEKPSRNSKIKENEIIKKDTKLNGMVIREEENEGDSKPIILSLNYVKPKQDLILEGYREAQRDFERRLNEPPPSKAEKLMKENQKLKNEIEEMSTKQREELRSMEQSLMKAVDKASKLQKQLEGGAKSKK